MIDLIIVQFISLVLGYVINNRTRRYNTISIGIRKDHQSKFVFAIMVSLLILFAGLRSKYNDTADYINLFRFVSVEDIGINALFKSYGGFNLFQQLIKKYVSSNPQILIFVSACITTYLYIRFINKWSDQYHESLYWFLIGPYIFSMAGIKQAIAIAISLSAINCFLEKKYIKMGFFLFFAMEFHPYTICLFAIIFLSRKVWDKYTIIICILCCISFANLDKLFSLISILGKDYSMESFTNYTINPLRVFIEMIPIILSFFYRHKIMQKDDRILALGVNMQIVSWGFIALGLFYKPIYLGRMSTYFRMISCITIPKLINVAFSGQRNEKVLKYGYYLIFTIYFILDMTKIGTISLFYDQFEHVNLFDMLLSIGQ